MVEIEMITDNPYHQLKDACCVTMGKRSKKDINEKAYRDAYNGDKESYDKVYRFFVDQFIAKHSVLRSVHFKTTDTICRADVMAQLIRATKGNPQPYCQSHRPDWNNGEKRKPSNETYSHYQEIWTAESFMAMCRQRLCFRAMKETREWVINILDVMRKSKNPFFNALAFCCVPECVFQGGCPEMKSCHLIDHQYSLIQNRIYERYFFYQNLAK